jgi:hypothetical protein
MPIHSFFFTGWHGFYRQQLAGRLVVLVVRFLVGATGNSAEDLQLQQVN